MKKFIVGLFAILLMANLNYGAALIVSAVKGGDAITFNSNIQDVKVYLEGNLIGKMSGTFIYKLNRTGRARTFKFMKSGYNTETVTIDTQFDPIFWANVLTGGGSTFGSSTDSWFTNGSKMYSPNQFYIEMEESN